jgi:GTP-binding protein Era
MNEQSFRCGFVAVVGRPNVGKSTLINAILGHKISIVTPRPQTTRHRILGVDSRQDCQIIFVDTPGLHRKARKAMNRMMNRTGTAEDQDVLKRLQSTAQKPVIALLNKIDKVHPRELLLETLAEMSARYDFAEVIPISAKREENLDRLTEVLPGFLPESEPLFPGHMNTDRSQTFRAAEIIREKLTLNLRQEVPYGITVQIERYVEDESGIAIDAVIWVERDSQKGIVVGKGGSVLKKVGRAARLELKAQTGVPVHLELWVKVKDNWADSEKDLMRLGYDSP